MIEPTFLVWSNQHRMWWGPAHRGYTGIIEGAGRYPREEAEGIVAKATLGGEIVHDRIDPITGGAYRSLDEVMVLAPECVGWVMSDERASTSER